MNGDRIREAQPNAREAPPAPRGFRHPVVKFLLIWAGLGAIVLGVFALAYVASLRTPASNSIIGMRAPQHIRLDLFVTRRLAGLNVTNDGDREWRTCRLTLRGGYETTVWNLKPKATKELGWYEFKSGSQSVPTGEGILRAERIDVECEDFDGNTRTSSYGSR